MGGGPHPVILMSLPSGRQAKRRRISLRQMTVSDAEIPFGFAQGMLRLRSPRGPLAAQNDRAAARRFYAGQRVHVLFSARFLLFGEGAGTSFLDNVHRCSLSRAASGRSTAHNPLTYFPVRARLSVLSERSSRES